VMTELARELQARPRRRYSYRFLFIPGTIGSITWLALNDVKIDHGLVAANLGDPGKFHYKKSRRSSFGVKPAEIDRAVLSVLKASGEPFGVEEFVPFGYDERQYCSPGFNLAVGSLTRTPYGRYPEYHTSADDLDFISPEALEGSLRTYLAVMDVLEGNRHYLNLNPKCEPQLGRRGLYRTIGGDESGRARELALLWVLNLSDGEHDLLGIAERSGLSFAAIREAADALLEAGLLEEAP
jgi:aminopeptidase-like protein